MTYTTTTTSGFASFNPPSANKPCKTFYKSIYPINAKPTYTPLIIIHGGPGMGHNYLLNLSLLTTNHGIPTIFYDQLGTGQSTHFPEKAGDRSFWTEDLFIAELENLIEQLGLKEYDVLGHSWGGMMGSKFASRQPMGLRKLVIYSSVADFNIRCEVRRELRSELPPDVRDALIKHHEAGTEDDPEYQTAWSTFVSTYFCSIPTTELPAEVHESNKIFNEDKSSALVMEGKSDFHCTGTLENWTMIGHAKNIVVPTLMINGNKEIASNRAMATYWREIQRVKWVKMMGSTHSAHLEEPERFISVVGQFLTDE